MSPFTCIVRRSGNPFEIAHVLVSWLIGAGYDAFVVVGCATRDVCMHIRYRTVCPDIPDETEIIEEEPEPEEEPRYRLVPLPDFSSKFEAMMAKREADRLQKEQDRIDAERAAKIADIEKPPADAIDGWRTHAWAVILPGPLGIEEPFFIEPSEGNHYPLDASRYQQIDSIYNNDNYYVNLQALEEDQNLSHHSYDLCDLTCWEHLLAGEPIHRRQMIGVDYSEKNTAVDTEKHLDMPASWVEKLDISAEDYQQRYPGFHKVIHYKRVLVEKFARYSEKTGIVKRIKIFSDYALTVPVLTYEYFENREDLMHTVRIDHFKKEIQEKFHNGRPDMLTKHTYAQDSIPTTVEAFRTLEFNYYARLDHLTRIECTPLSFDEYFKDREDLLDSRTISYTEPSKSDPKRQFKDIIETYRRNPEVPATEDVWKKIFHIQEETIDLLYHYAYNFVTNDNRNFIKPNLAETGGRILFFPDKTSGYISCPCAKPPRPLNIYYALCDNMDWEYKTTRNIRERETDTTRYLRQRYLELTEPRLYIWLFDTEMNADAKKGYLEQERQKAEIAAREKEDTIDPLAPYIARMFGQVRELSELQVSVKEATLLREQCINDFRTKQLARQVLVQERFDTLNSEYKTKRLWYLANQFILSPEKEAAYFVASAEMAFQVHSLEVRLTRHKDLSAPRFRFLEDLLDKHILLQEYNRVRAYYRHSRIMS